MAVTTLEAPALTDAGRTGRRSVAATPAAPARTRRPGRGTAPRSRPTRPASPPVVVGPAGLGAWSCSVSSPAVGPVVQPAGWRLTDRGVALVLVTGLMILTAALAVVGLTALRVTGERYQDAGGTVLFQP